MGKRVASRVGRTVIMAAACFFSLLLFNSPAAKAEEDSVFNLIQKGREIFQSVCNECHTNKLALDESYSEDDWTLTVSMMISNGANLTDEQKALVVDYLTTKTAFDTKCGICHGVDRALSKKKALEEWKSTVKRMAKMKKGLLSEDEIEAVSAFLTLGYPEVKK